MRQPIESEIAGYLKAGEIIKWIGQPIGGLRVRDVDMIIIPNTIILLGFGCILSVTTIHYHADFIFIFFGFSITLLGIYLIFPRFFLEKLKREATYYCITSQRVLILSGRRKRKFQSLPLQAITTMQITDEKNDEGYISFGENNALFSWLLGRFFSASETIPGFDKIKNVSMVFEILVQARENVVGGFPQQNLN
jgi:hypothetical protein